MKPSKADVAAMTERDYFAQLICWKRGSSIISGDDIVLAEKLTHSDFRQSLRNIDSHMAGESEEIHN